MRPGVLKVAYMLAGLAESNSAGRVGFVGSIYMSNYVIVLCMFIIELDYSWFTSYSHDSPANSLLTYFGSYTGVCLTGTRLLKVWSDHED